MTREEKEANLRKICTDTGPCRDCPAFDILGEGVECDFELLSDEVLDKYLKIFNVFPEKDLTVAETPDNVHPQHYKLPGGMEVIDVEVALFGREAVKHHCFCTAAEYILRHMQKNGAEDIRKAHWWLSKYIELEGEA